MPLSPITACNIRIRVDNALGVLTDISGEASFWNMSMEHQTSEFKTFYAAQFEDWFQAIQCGRKAEGAVRVVYDPQDTSALELLRAWWFAGGARTMSVDIPRGAGGDNYEMEIFLTTFPLEGDPASSDPLQVEFGFKVNGAVAYSAIVS